MSRHPHSLGEMGRPVIILTGEGASRHARHRPQRGRPVILSPSCGEDAGAPTIRHGGPVLAHQQMKNAFAGKPKASNRYLCSNGLEIVLAVDFGYCYNYQSCLNETYRCNLVQQHVRYACTRKHTLAAGVEISAVLSTLLPLQMH